MANTPGSLCGQHRLAKTQATSRSMSWGLASSSPSSAAVASSLPSDLSRTSCSTACCRIRNFFPLSSPSADWSWALMRSRCIFSTPRICSWLSSLPSRPSCTDVRRWMTVPDPPGNPPSSPPSRFMYRRKRLFTLSRRTNTFVGSFSRIFNFFF